MTNGSRSTVPAGWAGFQGVRSDGRKTLRLCIDEQIAWVPFFPLGGAFASMPKVTDEPAVTALAQYVGHTPAQVGRAWLLHHAPNVLLIPGTANTAHPGANVAAATITLDDTAMSALDAVPSRATDVPLGHAARHIRRVVTPGRTRLRKSSAGPATPRYRGVALWQTGGVLMQTYEFFYGPGIPAPVAA